MHDRFVRLRLVSLFMHDRFVRLRLESYINSTPRALERFLAAMVKTDNCVYLTVLAMYEGGGGGRGYDNLVKCTVTTVDKAGNEENLNCGKRYRYHIKCFRHHLQYIQEDL
jgi:hypothetical protein